MNQLTYLQKRRLRAIVCALFSLALLAGFLLWRQQFPPSKAPDTLQLKGDWQCYLRLDRGGNILYPLFDQYQQQVLDYAASLKKAEPGVSTDYYGNHRWVLIKGRTRYDIFFYGHNGYPSNTTVVYCYRLNSQGEAPSAPLWGMVCQGDPELYLLAYQSFQEWYQART